MTTATEDGPDPLDIAIGARVRARRRMLGLSQTALGDKLGVTFQQVQKYERGVNRISGSTLIRVGRELGVPAGSLLGDGEAGDAPAVQWGAFGVSWVQETAEALAKIKSAGVRMQIAKLARSLADDRLDELPDCAEVGKEALDGPNDVPLSMRASSH